MRKILILVMLCVVGCREMSSSRGLDGSDSVAKTQAGGEDLNSPPDPTAAPIPKWIWGQDKPKDEEVRFFRVTFDAGLPTTQKTEDPHSAWLWMSGDDQATFYLNGKQIAENVGYTDAVLVDVRSMLKPGQNVLSARCKNNVAIAGIAAKLVVKRQYGDPFVLVTDDKWKTWTDNQRGWRNAGFDDSKLASSKVLGEYGMEPWGKSAAAVAKPQATKVEDLTLLPGFKAELIYSVPKGSQGSWVSMTTDPKGRLYCSAEAGAIYRVTPGPGESVTKVEKVDLDIGKAQGMLWAFDSLYVVVNAPGGTNASGLYRLRDSNRDDQLDQLTKLKSFPSRSGDGPGWGEHGPHGIVLGADKKLYIVAGNFTGLPQGVTQMSPARHWSEDLLLERMTDGKGHDPTIYAPGSCICRTDKDGKNWEVVSVGMRNAYDIAFNPDGELFSYDSDMEWDIGTPWWRPIRVCHVVSGAEWGWRNGSAKWPAYYPDSVPPTVETGMGSPTGVVFGTGAKFPAKYQRAFFINDWAYGKIYAVHMKPKGATYSAEYEPFITGKPFGVTDIVVNKDGAMYVTIGGRGTQSGLYRVTYVGDESTATVAPIRDREAERARDARHKLESFHVKTDPGAVAFAWPYLDSSDRSLRYAARIAIEAQDPATWTERALSENSPVAAANALVSLCRVGNASLQPRVLAALSKFDLSKLPKDQLLEMLRAYELCFIRMGRPMDPAAGPGVATKLNALFPATDTDVNHELCQLLVYLQSPEVIGKSLALLDKANTQEEQLFYTFQLRNLREGWTQPQREAYFKWLNRAEKDYKGGASYKQFLEHVRADAVKSLGDNERVALAKLIKPEEKLASTKPAATQPAHTFVKNWTLDDLKPKLDKLKTGRSYEKGKAAYAAVSCAICHRFNGDGGGSGPDISGVGSRFQPADLLESIIVPSKIISDQYQATEIITKKKNIVVGTVQEENNDKVIIRSSPLSTMTETVAKSDIAVRRPSKVSVMPQGLIDVLSEDEVLDLVAYLRSAGNPRDTAFQPAAKTGSPKTASTVTTQPAASATQPNVSATQPAARVP